MALWTYQFIFQSILILFSRRLKHPHSEWNATVVMPLSLLLLFLTVLDTLDVFPKAENYMDAAEALLSVYMCLIMLNYFLFIKNDTYKALLEDYKSKGKLYKNISSGCGVVIGIGGIVFPLLYLLLAL